MHLGDEVAGESVVQKLNHRLFVWVIALIIIIKILGMNETIGFIVITIISKVVSIVIIIVIRTIIGMIVIAIKNFLDKHLMNTAIIIVAIVVVGRVVVARIAIGIVVTVAGVVGIASMIDVCVLNGSMAG